MTGYADRRPSRTVAPCEADGPCCGGENGGSVERDGTVAEGSRIGTEDRDGILDEVNPSTCRAGRPGACDVNWSWGLLISGWGLCETVEEHKSCGLRAVPVDIGRIG